MANRVPDWPERLYAQIEAAKTRPYSWGRHDCALFAADSVLALTGIDPVPDLRGRYDCAFGAARALKRFCGGGREDAVAIIAGRVDAREVVPALARRGDVALVDNGGRAALAVFLGARLAAPHFQKGLAMLPRACARRAWAIGWE